MLIQSKKIKTKVTHHICEFHKKSPFSLFAGCTCSASISTEPDPTPQPSTNFIQIIKKACLLCNEVKEINTIIPRPSYFEGKYICGDCFAKHLDYPLKVQILLRKLTTV